MDKKLPDSKPKKRIFFELLSLILGFVMIYTGIIDERNHVSSVSYNSKGCMSVHTGALDVLYGVIIIIGSVCSIYFKFKSKNSTK